MSTMTDGKRSGIWKVITASTMGTLIEWYDFYIFGSLSVVLSTKFFPADNPTAAFLSTLATFAAGFIVRPFGALFFGRLGDVIGRKFTFIVTLVLMGGATFVIGCVPSFETIGYAAPILVLLMRLFQGLALGGEYGGAATYVAEHSPKGQKGYWTSWVQITAIVGLLISLVVILLTKLLLTEEQFDSWGWRLPFWVSLPMVYISYLIRKKMHESPAFEKAKSEGKTSSNPLKESFGNRYNLKFVLLALFGATMGQGVIFYTGQFYAMGFMKTVMFVNSTQADYLLAIALLVGTPFFILFGWLSDKIGRKSIMMGGILIAVLTYRPIYDMMYQTSNIEKKVELKDQASLSSDLKVIDKNKQDSVYISNKVFEDGTLYKETKTIHFENGKVVEEDGKPKEIISKVVTLSGSDQFTIFFLLLVQILFVAMVYGPIAAFLVELFPVNIRYTSMSLPYHVGNGIFGGLLPAVSTYFVTNAKNVGDPQFYLEGLWYPIVIGVVSLIIGVIYIDKSTTKHSD